MIELKSGKTLRAAAHNEKTEKLLAMVSKNNITKKSKSGSHIPGMDDEEIAPALSKASTQNYTIQDCEKLIRVQDHEHDGEQHSNS